MRRTDLEGDLACRAGRRGHATGGGRERVRRSTRVRQSARTDDPPPRPLRDARQRSGQMAASDLSDLKPVYLIYGTEELLLERAVKRLRDRLAAVADLDFNLETFDGESSSADDIVNASNTMPFMSERRLVIVRDVDKLDAAGIEALVGVREGPGALHVPRARRDQGREELEAVQGRRGDGRRVRVRRPEAQRVRRRGREAVPRPRASGSACRRPTPSSRSVGRDLRRLDAEADKIAAYVGEAEEVTLADVGAVASASATTSVFEFLDAVGSRDVGRSLRLLRGLLDDGESAIGIHAMLARHVRALIGARALSERRRAPPTRWRPSSGWRRGRRATRRGRPWTTRPRSSRGRSTGLAAAEEEMKTSPTDAGLVIERWIVAVAGGDPREVQ